MSSAADTIRLIAHRGGVVEGRYHENSPDALDAAVRRGYAAVEIDLRETSDGAIVCYHDPSIASGFLRRRRVRDVSIGELRGAVGSWILTLDEMLDRCRDRVDVMIDVKHDAPGERFLRTVSDALTARAMLGSAMVIGARKAKEFLAGTTTTAVPVRQLLRGERGIDSVGEREFVFAHATQLPDPLVEQLLERSVRIIPSINRFHYLPRLDPPGPAGEDIDRLVALGCTELQIDSEFDRFVPGFRR